jgi:uncharacterized protein YjbI with pentapeptide repeats
MAFCSQDIVGPHLSLSSQNFTNCNLSGVDFSGSDVSNTIFTGATVNGTNFASANLSGASLNKLTINGLVPSLPSHFDFTPNSKMGGESILGPGISINGMDFTGFSYIPATVELYNLIGTAAALPAGASVKSGVYGAPAVNLSGANLNGLDLSGMNFQYADFSHASLVKANLSNGNFATAKFVGANLTGSNMRSSDFSCGMSTYHCYAIGADFTSATFAGADIQYSNFAGAIFTQSEIVLSCNNTYGFGYIGWTCYPLNNDQHIGPAQ